MLYKLKRENLRSLLMEISYIHEYYNELLLHQELDDLRNSLRNMKLSVHLLNKQIEAITKECLDVEKEELKNKEEKNDDEKNGE